MAKLTLRSVLADLWPLSAALIAAAACGVGGWAAGLPLPPRPPTHGQPVTRHEPLDVTPELARPIGLLYGDFDLHVDVELAAATELDIVLRRVEADVGDPRSPAFGSRFAVLRLSTERRGEALLTREQALFDAPRGGQLIAAGQPATVLVQARGSELRANVAGVWHGPLATVDSHGSLAFVTRGGNAVVRRIDLLPVPPPRRLLPWAGCALIGAALGVALGLLRRTGMVRIAAAFAAVPALGFLGGLLILSHVQYGAAVEPSTPYVVGLSGLPLALGLALARKGRLVIWAGGSVAWLAAGELAARTEAVRLAPLEDPRLEAYFGPSPGATVYDALAGRMRSSVRVHTLAERERCVFFLGGRLLFESEVFGPAELGFHVDPGDPEAGAGYSHAAQTEQMLGSMEATSVPCVVAATVDSSLPQQVRLFERFYAASYRPRVVVVAVPPWEGEPAVRTRPADALAAGGVSSGPSRLLDLWSAARAPLVPAADEEGLAAAFGRLARLAAEYEFDVVLFDVQPPPAFGEVIDRAVAEHGFVRVANEAMADGRAAVDVLVDRIVRLLRS